MNASTAILVVALLGAAALATAALLTARSRIGEPPAKADVAGLSETARHFRVFGWIFVLFLYLLAMFCLLQGLNALRIVHHWAVWEQKFGDTLAAQAEMTLYSRFWFAIAIVFVAVALWTQRRLRRRAM